MIMYDCTMVLIFCVDIQELSHLTRDLSQAEKKINVLQAEQMQKNDIYFTQNSRSFHLKVLR